MAFSSGMACFNLDVHCIFCIKLIYFQKTFHLNYDLKYFENLECLDFENK